MKVLMLGTTGYHPNERRHTACIMLPEIGLVFDAGTAMFRVRDHLATSELDIFLSHAHLDHVVGLTFLFDILHEKPVERVRVHARADKLAAVRTHLFCEALFPVSPPYEDVPLGDPWTLKDGGRLSFFPLEHPGGSIGYRVDWKGSSMAYVTDTTATEDAPYIERIQGVDLLIHECYFPDAMAAQAVKTGHSHTTPVAQLAKRAGAKRLVLVHLNPLSLDDDPIGLQTARAIFPRTEIATDGMELSV